MDIMEEEIVQGDNLAGQEYYTDDMQQVEIEQQHEADLGLDLQLSGDEGKIIFSSCLVFLIFLLTFISWKTHQSFFIAKLFSGLMKRIRL